MNALAWLRGRQRWADLNVGLPLWVYGSVGLLALGGFPGVPGHSPAVSGIVITGLAVLLVGWAGRWGLSPRTVRPGGRGRHTLGHAWLLVLNLAVAGTVILPFALAQVPGLAAIGHLIWIGIFVSGLALLAWPVGLLLVGTARGGPEDPPAFPSGASPAPGPGAAHGRVWRVGHRGRDMMYYEEQVEGRWERLDISGEMLMGPAHHAIYFASATDWQRYPVWARGRRAEIIGRVRQAFAPPDYEHHGA